MSKKKRAGRNIEIIETDDISQMGISEEEYRVLEDEIDPILNECEITPTNKEE